VTTTTTDKVLKRIAEIRNSSMIINRAAGKMPTATVDELCDLLEALLAEREAANMPYRDGYCEFTAAQKAADAALARFAGDDHA
jgi:hypothetical protein